MKNKFQIKESFDNYVNFLIKKSFNIKQIDEDFSGGVIMPSTFKGDAMSGNPTGTHDTNKRDAMSGYRNMDKGFDKTSGYRNMDKGFDKTREKPKYDAFYGEFRDKNFASYIEEYTTMVEGRKDIYGFIEMLKNMDDEKMMKNINILANAMISADPNTHANRDFNKKYKQKGITRKEQLVQAIAKEVMDRKNHKPNSNM
jgi:hypothetical protein